MLGVIEGFYGRSWTHSERLSMLRFLASNQCDSYIYAPKSDNYLRKSWHEVRSLNYLQSLHKLRLASGDAGIQFGIGFSPHGLHLQWDSETRLTLHQQLQDFKGLQLDCLSVLFDDMRGDIVNLAKIQREITDFIANESIAEKIIFCPSYYSNDPILETLFGAKPEDYWSDLSTLDSTIDIFWTGEKVISQNYECSELTKFATIFNRKPLIWDNSIVTDGKTTSPFLPIRPMFNLNKIQPYTKGVLINPMNAAALSELVMSTLFIEGENRLEQVISQLDSNLSQLINLSLNYFNNVGLESLLETDKAMLKARFNEIEHPTSSNIIDWLDGCFQFDSSCLT